MSINIESSFSFNGSLIKESSFNNIRELGYEALGLVDNNTAFFLTFYKKMKKENIKPLLGLKIKDKYFDVIIYPKNYLGYKETLKYASTKNKDDLIDYDNFIYSNNIIYCLDVTFLENDNNLIYLNNIYNLFKERNLDVYVGVDFSYYPCEVGLYPLIKDKYKIIIINKVKYLNKDDKKASEVLEAILSRSKLNVGNLFDMGKVYSYHLKTYKEFLDEYIEYPELIKNTKDFIDLVNIEIEFKYHFPKYISKDNTPSNDYLTFLTNKGLSKRLEGTKKDYKKYKERLEYELDIINKMGFSDYFLVVYDYILFAKKQGIYVGPGRGSGASSLVSYTLGIIDIDPLEYDLLFERFLNPSRKTMPDIDTDFEDTRKDDVIRYCMDKYGDDHVSLVSTYQTFLAKGALSDVSKVLEIEAIKVRAVSKELEDIDNTISSLMMKPIIKDYYDNDEEIRELLDISKRIEGCPKSIGVHASAVIISDDSIYNYSEMHLIQNGFNSTTYDADSLKDIGLVKMDFLSLTTLSAIHEVVKNIENNQKIKINLNKIPLNDPKTYDLFRNKPITGIFQFETKGMTDLIKKIEPTEFKDLCIATALYRPGSNKYSNEYIRRKKQNGFLDYYDPCLKNILKETLGIIVYQEQIMQIINVYSGLSLAEADILRRAISDKNVNLLLELKNKFYLGAKDNGRNEVITKKLFDDILEFAGYGFNKSHSVAYSKISYIMAYLKANYPTEFITNLLEDTASESESYRRIIKDSARFKINILPPDIRFSSVKYRSSKNNIMTPFTKIKGVGKEYAKTIFSIVHSDNNDDFSFENLISRCKGVLPRELIEDLILADAFDYTGYNKKTMIEALDGLYEFDIALVKKLNYKIRNTEEYDFEYLKSKEKEFLGYNPKYHPLRIYDGALKKISDISYSPLAVKIVAYLTDLVIMRTKAGDTMARFKLEDECESVDSILFTKDYHNNSRFLKNNTIYEVYGTYKENNGSSQFIVRELKPIYNV